MNQRLTPSTALLLTTAPLLWAGNAVVGRLMQGLVPPVTLNFLRWFFAGLILMPLAGWVVHRNSPLWPQWRRFAVLGLAGVGCYNALQYLALKTSTPMNVTLVGASVPVFMLAFGALFFGRRPSPRQYVGAVLSMLGVVIVLCRGDWDVLMQVRLVRGDVYMLLATASWSLYSWLLIRPGDAPRIRGDWAAFLLAQIVFGLGWSGLFAAGEWAMGAAPIQWGWPLAAGLAFVAIGPAVVAYRCWGLGVQRVGPTVAAFFSNLTPLFAAVMSAAFLGEWPHLYHAVGFLLIVGGIIASSRR